MCGRVLSAGVSCRDGSVPIFFVFLFSVNGAWMSCAFTAYFSLPVVVYFFLYISLILLLPEASAAQENLSLHGTIILWPEIDLLFE